MITLSQMSLPIGDDWSLIRLLLLNGTPFIKPTTSTLVATMTMEDGSKVDLTPNMWTIDPNGMVVGIIVPRAVTTNVKPQSKSIIVITTTSMYGVVLTLDSMTITGFALDGARTLTTGPGIRGVVTSV